MLYRIVFVADTWDTSVLSKFPDFSLLSLPIQPVVSCPSSARLSCVSWASLTPGRSKVAAKSPLYLQSKLWSPTSPYKWLHDHGVEYQLDLVFLWKAPPTTDLVLWQALAQGGTMRDVVWGSAASLGRGAAFQVRRWTQGHICTFQTEHGCPILQFLAVPRPGELEL